VLHVVSYYYDKESARLDGRFARDADKYGWNDFIDVSYAPPAPVVGLEAGAFQPGDLVSVYLVKGFVTSEGQNQPMISTYRVVSAEKLLLPTQQELFQRGQQIMRTYADTIADCAKAPKFGSGQMLQNVAESDRLETTRWDPHTNTGEVYFSHQGYSKDCQGEYQQMSVVLRFDSTLRLIRYTASSKCGVYLL
jgi:hypothetical protein